jgi:hypothetical protein
VYVVISYSSADPSNHPDDVLNTNCDASPALEPEAPVNPLLDMVYGVVRKAEAPPEKADTEVPPGFHIEK